MQVDAIAGLATSHPLPDDGFDSGTVDKSATAAISEKLKGKRKAVPATTDDRPSISIDYVDAGEHDEASAGDLAASKASGKALLQPPDAHEDGMTRADPIDATSPATSNPDEADSPAPGALYPLRSRSANNFIPPTNEAQDPRHRVPFGWNGPIPKPDDPEDIQPSPHLTLQPGSELFGQAHSFPTNRHGWRYDACVPAADVLPWQVFKVADVGPRGVHWSWQDRSTFTHINADATELTADKGFRSARANVGVREGCWYCEVEVLEPEELEPGKGGPGHMAERSPEGPHVRIGWGRREARLNAPAGFDGYSYGFRDKTGERVTIARPTPYGKPYGPGDVVGMWIKLPPARQPNREDPWDPAKIRRVRVPIRFRGHLYYEILDYPLAKEMEFIKDESRRGNRKVDESGRIIQVVRPEDVPGTGLGRKKRLAPGEVDKAAADREKLIASLRPVPILEDSEIAFFVNGEPQGVAFRDLYDYRPLRRHEEQDALGLENKKRCRRTADVEGEGEQELSASASLRAINKSRTNYFDDGSTGYFPFVSLYGGARVRLNPGPHFKHPPPEDIENVLHPDSAPKGRTWRPLSERYDEWLEEQLSFDKEEEARAQIRQQKIAQVAEWEARELAKHPSKRKGSAIGSDAAASASPALENLVRKQSKKGKGGFKRRSASVNPSGLEAELGKSESPSESLRPSPAPNGELPNQNGSAGPMEEEPAMAEDRASPSARFYASAGTDNTSTNVDEPHVNPHVNGSASFASVSNHQSSSSLPHHSYTPLKRLVAPAMPNGVHAPPPGVSGFTNGHYANGHGHPVAGVFMERGQPDYASAPTHHLANGGYPRDLSNQMNVDEAMGDVPPSRQDHPAGPHHEEDETMEDPHLTDQDAEGDADDEICLDPRSKHYKRKERARQLAN